MKKFLLKFYIYYVILVKDVEGGQCLDERT